MSTQKNTNLSLKNHYVFCIYILSIIFGSISWMLSTNYKYAIRGGLISNFLFYILTLSISITGVILIFQSNLSRWFKFGLSTPQGLGVMPLTWLIIQLMPIILFFGPGICITNFVSPSGHKSIAIQDACFMDCTHTVVRHYWMVEKEVGEIPLNSGKVCKMGKSFRLTWNSAETAITWQVNNQTGGSLVVDSQP
jgi:hypothetical protein